jgi:hypothetical protein
MFAKFLLRVGCPVQLALSISAISFKSDFLSASAPTGVSEAWGHLIYTYLSHFNWNHRDTNVWKHPFIYGIFKKQFLYSLDWPQIHNPSQQSDWCDSFSVCRGYRHAPVYVMSFASQYTSFHGNLTLPFCPLGTIISSSSTLRKLFFCPGGAVASVKQQIKNGDLSEETTE